MARLFCCSLPSISIRRQRYQSRRCERDINTGRRAKTLPSRQRLAFSPHFRHTPAKIFNGSLRRREFAEERMRRTDFRPMLADEAPSADMRTDYDEEHLMTYRGLLDAELEGAEW